MAERRRREMFRLPQAKVVRVRFQVFAREETGILTPMKGAGLSVSPNPNPNRQPFLDYDYDSLPSHRAANAANYGAMF